MTAATQVLELLLQARSGSAMSRARASAQLISRLRSLSAAQQRALAVEIAGVVAPQAVDQISAEGDLELSSDQVTALVAMAKDLDASDIATIRDALADAAVDQADEAAADLRSGDLARLRGRVAGVVGGVATGTAAAAAERASETTTASTPAAHIPPPAATRVPPVRPAPAAAPAAPSRPPTPAGYAPLPDFDFDADFDRDTIGQQRPDAADRVTGAAVAPQPASSDGFRLPAGCGSYEAGQLLRRWLEEHPGVTFDPDVTRALADGYARRRLLTTLARHRAIDPADARRALELLASTGDRRFVAGALVDSGTATAGALRGLLPDADLARFAARRR